MADQRYVDQLEAVLAQMLQPVRGVPFPVVVKALAQKEVVPFDFASKSDQEMLRELELAMISAGRAVAAKPIYRPRPNEVGNDIEPFIMSALNEIGFSCSRPTGSSGAGKAAGYPDLVFKDRSGRTVYLECKSMAARSKDTSFRSFYLSPSDSFKVTQDGLHLLVGFQMERSERAEGGLFSFVPTAFKLVDLSRLECDVKYEFNSDNRRLYAERAILLERPIL